MLYIITEDSNSARYFWKCVAKTFRKSTEYIMVPQQIDNVCNNQCLYCCKKKSTKEKLIDLENKSLCITNLPFCFEGDK